jgi:hypothetical protein
MKRTTTCKILIGFYRPDNKTALPIRPVGMPELKKQHSINIDKKKIVLPDGIKEVGKFSVDVKLYPSISGKITVEVIGA